ncbi:uncharacterized protein KRP23_11285 [Phytophthora ramorum]|uniref:uncharacterized protein n=1 Tax=Phytophthora ramorum TaxID=164328 RepID=UPI0030A8783E|nr:hypothetical protein KRP23_11285 [Phytophthora ramorum]
MRGGQASRQKTRLAVKACIARCSACRTAGRQAEQQRRGLGGLAGGRTACARAGPTVSRASLNALARFLSREIQHAGATTLQSLLHRLEMHLESEQDFEQLSWQLVSILTKIESPDAVWNTVEQIAECVAPLATPREEGEVDVDSADSTLVRTSLLGVFVRSFLLAVNRLLFDGLSRIFDDVKQYLEQFREDVEREKKMGSIRCQRRRRTTAWSS